MSSFITKIEKVGKNVQVSMKTGETYEFKNVPAKVAKDFMSAESRGESAGRFFTSKIRGKFDQEIIAW